MNRSAENYLAHLETEQRMLAQRIEKLKTAIAAYEILIASLRQISKERP